MSRHLGWSIVALMAMLSVGQSAARQVGPSRAKQKKSTKANPAANRPPAKHSDVSYGPHERNRLDFWQAPSKSKTPLIVFAHGGGFVGGDKRSFPTAVLQKSLASGISFATINYRFVGNGVTFPAPQQDGARAIQFLRSKAEEWNIDKRRIAAFGNSAGGGIVLWLAFHDDMADAQARDPVAKESTRVAVVGSIGGQSTYDPIAIKNLIGGRAWEHPSLFKVYGIASGTEALNPTPELQKLYDEVSAIKHLTKDDPPAFMIFAEPTGPLPANARPGQGIHHPKFARLMSTKMKELGIETAYRHAADGKPGDPHEQMVEFFRKHLAAAN